MLIRILVIFIVSLTSAFAGPEDGRYDRHKIAVARFGASVKQKALERAGQIAARLDQQHFGQERMHRALQAKITAWVANRGSSNGAPAAAHIMGLPGTGKSDIASVLREVGFSVAEPIVVPDFFRSLGYDGSGFQTRISSATDFYSIKVHKLPRNERPYRIVIIDEIDKAPEIVEGRPPAANGITSALSSVLNEGYISNNDLDVSDIFFITTSNFGPRIIAKYEAQLGKPFHSWDFADLRGFDRWLATDIQARYGILSSIFMSNTVSRLAPNMIVASPLFEGAFKQIIAKKIHEIFAAVGAGSIGGTGLHSGRYGIG